MTYRTYENVLPDEDDQAARGVQILVTGEGIILDAFREDENVGTFAKTFDELYEWLVVTEYFGKKDQQ